MRIARFSMLLRHSINFPKRLLVFNANNLLALFLNVYAKTYTVYNLWLCFVIFFKHFDRATAHVSEYFGIVHF